MDIMLSPVFYTEADNYFNSEVGIFHHIINRALGLYRSVLSVFHFEISQDLVLWASFG